MRRGLVVAVLICCALLGGALARAAQDLPPPTIPPSGAIIEAPATPPTTTGPRPPSTTPAPGAPPGETSPSSGGVAAATGLTFGVLGGARPGEEVAVSPVLQRIALDLGERAPEVVLGTGDYVAGSLDPATLERQYQWLFYALQPLQARRVVPVAFAPGPHDIRGSSANARAFAAHFGGLYYSFDRWAAHFIILDTEIPGQEQRIMGDQWWWLVGDLYQALGARYLFVALGRPLFPVASGRGSSLDRYPQYRDALHNLLRDYRVSAVFCGGEGLYDYQERDGVRYFITGGAGDQLDETAGPARAFPHYLWVRCSDEGFQVEAVPTGN
jgi:hypothetical protein